jgi:hypothetical protein
MLQWSLHNQGHAPVRIEVNEGGRRHQKVDLGAVQG